MSLPIEVPWFSLCEFQELYRELYSNDVQKQKHALSRVTAWRCRCKFIEVSIECTATLIDTMIAYSSAMNTNTPSESDRMLRINFGYALSKFVNDITETHQKPHGNKTLQVVGKYLGIPEWLITLRHEIVHGELPSLEFLFKGVTWAVKYLKHEFWEKRLKFLNDPTQKDVTTVDEQVVRVLIVNYQRSRFKDLNHGVGTETTMILKDIDTSFEFISNFSLSVMIEDGYLIPTEEQLSSIGVDANKLPPCVTLNSSRQMVQDAIDRLNPINSDRLDLPPELVEFWEPLLKVLQKNDVIKHLVEAMLMALSQQDGLRNRLIGGWLMVIFKSIEQADSVSYKPADCQTLDNFKCCISWTQCFQLCIKIGVNISIRLAHWILQNNKPSLSSIQREILRQLISVYLEEELDKTEDNDDQIYTVNDVQTLLLQENGSVQSDLMNSPWRVCTDAVEWDNYPIGLLPNQTLTYTNLEICDAMEDYIQRDWVSLERNDLNQ